MNRTSTVIDQELHRSGGALRLRPTYVRRYYRDGGRLGVAGDVPGATLRPKEQLYVPERWIASTCLAANPSPRRNEGLSILDIPGWELSLKDGLAAHPEILLGSEYASNHQNEFRVLTKILDPCEPIVFHVHPSDEMVAKHRGWFRGHRFGKDEAYYFPPSPKGVCPYTHYGLHPGVTAEDLLAATEQGRDAVTDLSPALHQRFGTGIYMPSGMPHSPGTALTLEIQQPSDADALLENRPPWGGRPFTRKQRLHDIPRVEDALGLVNFAAATRKNVVETQQIEPELFCRAKGADEHWICPPRFTAKFSGKRLVMRPGASYECQERGPYAVLVWRGRGRVARTDFRAERGWDEFFVSAPLAVSAHRYENTGEAALELFKLFPQDVNL